MKKYWKERNTNEKIMMIFILVMLIVIAINWEKVSEGFSKGVKNYQTESKE